MQHKHDPKLTPAAKALRKNMTPEERHLWYDFLRSYPVRFLRQKVVDGCILDFYCARAKLAVEVDGSQHFLPDGASEDAARTRRLSTWGIAVLRIPNNAVRTEFSAVCRQIDETVQSIIGK